MRVTPAQKKVLVRARDFGNPWSSGERHPVTGISFSAPWNASTSRCIDTLVEKGLLTYAKGKGHCRPEITPSGREAVNRVPRS